MLLILPIIQIFSRNPLEICYPWIFSVYFQRCPVQTMNNAHFQDLPIYLKNCFLKVLFPFRIINCKHFQFICTIRLIVKNSSWNFIPYKFNYKSSNSSNFGISIELILHKSFKISICAFNSLISSWAELYALSNWQRISSKYSKLSRSFFCLSYLKRSKSWRYCLSRNWCV